MSGKRAIIIVLDSLGVGALPDAGAYGDEGSHTLDHVARAAGGLYIPNLVSLGVGLIEGVNSIEKAMRPIGSYGRMTEKSPGKDTTTGHWEITGIILDKPFPTYPNGFPEEMLDRFTALTGYGWLWGKTASGTEIIERLGAEHLKTGKVIVYTSADSVFQIAAHEGVTPLAELYRISSVARGLVNEYNIGRVIARPFTGAPGSFKRTAMRKDFSMPPPRDTLIDAVKAAGMETIGIGKVGDVFSHRGFTREIKAYGNAEVAERLKDETSKRGEGLVLATFVDFDMLYGHRNDPAGYAKALTEADRAIGEVMQGLHHGDLLIITADHGCDPTTPSTDHSREYVPVLAYGPGFKAAPLGTRKSFSDAGNTAAAHLAIDGIENGVSFLGLMTEE